MRRKLFPARKARRSPRIEIIPMVDVMFLMLVFYILSSLALHNSKGIPVNLPVAQSGDPAARSEELVVSITPAGDFYVNKDKVSSESLGPALEKWASTVSDRTKVNVTLNADMGAQHRYVVQAMDALRKLGVTNFTISTQPSHQARS